MTSFRVEIPPHVAAVIRTLHPDLKALVKSAIRAIAANPECGEPLKRELAGLHKYRVRRFRIVYSVDQEIRIIRLMAVGHRRSVYEGRRSSFDARPGHSDSPVDSFGVAFPF